MAIRNTPQYPNEKSHMNSPKQKCRREFSEHAQKAEKKIACLSKKTSLIHY